MNEEEKLEIFEALLEGKTVEFYEDERWLTVLNPKLNNPLTYPDHKFRIAPEEWERVYESFTETGEITPNLSTRQAFKIGWEEARKRHG